MNIDGRNISKFDPYSIYCINFVFQDNLVFSKLNYFILEKNRLGRFWFSMLFKRTNFVLTEPTSTPMF